MTTIPTRRPPKPAPTRRHLEVAGELVRRNKLKPKKGVARDQVVKALATALAATPPRAEHGRLLAASLKPR